MEAPRPVRRDPAHCGEARSIQHHVRPRFYTPSVRTDICTRNACSIFRAWQGWTAMSSTGPGEGTLRVLPMLSLASAYIILRPFFRPRNAASSSLKFEDWVPDLDSPSFPGSAIGKTQELNERTHPHLQLARTMVSVPRSSPETRCTVGHCSIYFDYYHDIDPRAPRRGIAMLYTRSKRSTKDKGDSSVLYIPTVPLTVHKYVPSSTSIVRA